MKLLINSSLQHLCLTKPLFCHPHPHQCSVSWGKRRQVQLSNHCHMEQLTPHCILMGSPVQFLFLKNWFFWHIQSQHLTFLTLPTTIGALADQSWLHGSPVIMMPSPPLMTHQTLLNQKVDPNNWQQQGDHCCGCSSRCWGAIHSLRIHWEVGIYGQLFVVVFSCAFVAWMFGFGAGFGAGTFIFVWWLEVGWLLFDVKMGEAKEVEDYH